MSAEYQDFLNTPRQKALDAKENELHGMSTDHTAVLKSKVAIVFDPEIYGDLALWQRYNMIEQYHNLCLQLLRENEVAERKGWNEAVKTTVQQGFVPPLKREEEKVDWQKYANEESPGEPPTGGKPKEEKTP